MQNLAPKYTLFNSINEMLAAETLSDLLNRKVFHVTMQPFDSTNGFSSNQLFHVEADGQKLVLKRLRPSVDWLAIGSADHLCRSIRVWQYGLLDCIQPHMQHGILTACREGDDYAILMQDVSSGLLNGQELTPQAVYRMLDALAGMHAVYWEQENLKAGDLGLTNLDTKLSFSIGSPKEEHFQHAPHILDIVKKGQNALFDLVEPDVSASLQSVAKNLQSLRTFLEKLPATFVHTDFRQDNLAFFPDTQELVAFDWQMAGYAPVVLDLCWFVGSLAGVLDQHESYYQYYRQRLSTYLGDRFDQSLWQPMLEVGCLVEVLSKGSWHAFFAVTSEDESFRKMMRRSVNSYNNIVRKALQWL
jgi:hypothetical protein